MSRGEGWQTVDARLATLSADEALTIAQRPRSTIVPSDVGAPSQRDLALALLRDLGVATEQRLRLERTLGEGGMGVVRLATQASMGRAVAVKTLRPGAADDLAALRLLREAWVAGQLEHPNVLPVYDVTLDEHGTPQVVMKRIDGVDLATLLADPAALRERAGGDPTAFHLRVLMQVASALHFAHDRGILHRDVKPENVMLGRFDEVYVVDWGIAVSLRDDQDPRLPRVAEATDLAGTPAYLAPEMLEGDPSRLGPWTDVYLLGATLFEVFAGRPPHEGPTLGALFASSLASPPTVPAQVPEEIAEICRRAMARAPGDRYASAGELRAALADVLDHRESMRLAHRAQTRLGALLEELAEQPPPDAAEVRRLFDECRFGFRAALDAWPANPVAKGALRLALEAMAGHEVSAGNLPAARAVVAELEAPPAELLRQLADLERRTATEASERSRLRALERDLDPRVGSRTRTFLSAVLGSLWTALPIVSHFLLGARDSGPEIQASMATAAGSLPLVLGLGYWARESLRKTALNRRIFALLLFVLASQLVLGAACLVAGVASAVAVPLTFFLWFVAAGLAAITIEIGAWPTALAFLVCLFLALSEPRWTLVLMGISQAILTVNALAIWGPLLRAPRDAPR